jgi:hypothetical protein
MPMLPGHIARCLMHNPTCSVVVFYFYQSDFSIRLMLPISSGFIFLHLQVQGTSQQCLQPNAIG